METEEGEDNIETPPELFVLSGDWELYEKALFKIFKDTIVEGKLDFLGMPVRTRWLPSSKGKHFTFWHLISEGEKEEERIPNLRRCERLKWVAWVLDNYNIHPKIDHWPNRRKGSRNYVVWYNEEYAVILTKRNGYFLLKSAYCTFSQRKKESFRKERNDSREEKKD